MKLTIKTLQQLTFTIEIEPEKSVKDLKEKIEADHGKEFPCSAQKLIYSGKILVDDSKLSEYEIDEKKFIVLMITRPPPAPKPAEVEKPATAKTEAAGATSSKEEKSKQATTQSSSSSNSSVSIANTASTTVPTTTTTTTSSTQQLGRAASRGVPELGTFMVGDQNIAPRLATLMAQPHFRQIQDLIQQHPHLLSSTIEALAGSDPDMYSFISEHPDSFVNALNQPPLGGGRMQSSRGSSSGQPASRVSDRSAHETQNLPADIQQNIGAEQMIDNITDHDKQAIARLKELGFSELQVVQAYVACDKDEQLAANLLFQMDP